LIGPGASRSWHFGQHHSDEPIDLPAKTGAVNPAGDCIDNVTDIGTGLAGTNTLLGTITLNGSTYWAVGSDAGKLIVKGNVVNSQSGASCVLWLRPGVLPRAFGQAALKDASGTAILNILKTTAARDAFRHQHV